MRSNTATVTRGGAVLAGGAVVDGRRCHVGHDELSSGLAGVRALQARLEFVALALVGEVDRRGSHVQDGALTAAAWARMHTRMSPREATAAVRTGRVLRSGEVPRTREALRAGEIDGEHVRVIADGVTDAPAGAAALIEGEALEAARRSDPREVAGVMRMFGHALDPDGADEAALARYDRRGLSAASTLDGMVAGSFLADEVSGSLILTALNAASPLVSGDRRTAAQRRLDAFADICRRYLASPDAPMSGGGHAHVIVTMDNDTARATSSRARNDAGTAGPTTGTPATTNETTTGATTGTATGTATQTAPVWQDRTAARPRPRLQARPADRDTGRRAGRCPGSGGSPARPRGGSPATRTSPWCGSVRTGPPRWWTVSSGSSPGPSARR